MRKANPAVQIILLILASACHPDTLPPPEEFGEPPGDTTDTGDPEPNDLPSDSDPPPDMPGVDFPPEPDLGGVGEPCPCAEGLVCIDGACGPCPAGQLGCACEAGEMCDQGLGCAKSLDGSHVCGLLADPASGRCFDHGLALDLPSVEVDGVCVASCVQGDDCGWLECSPVDAKAQGFCAF